MELLKTITLSNQENLIMVANQNILIKLFDLNFLMMKILQEVLI